MVNFYKDWKTMMKAEYRTPSPHPELDLFISPKPEMYVRNYPFESGFYITQNALHRDPGIYEYFHIQAAILKFNNTKNGKGFTKEVCQRKLEVIARWESNTVLMEKHSVNISDAIKQAVESVYEDDFDYTEILRPIAQLRQRWYGQRIEDLTHKEKIAAKAKARGELNSMVIREDIKDVADDYQLCNYNVKPTASFVVDNTSYSKPTIIKHGRDQIISTKENTSERIKVMRSMYPEYTQSQVADKLDISIRTVRSYWHN